MEKTWDVTIMKIGSIRIKAETREEAIEKAANITITPASVNWEDNWSAVDASGVEKSLC